MLTRRGARPRGAEPRQLCQQQKSSTVRAQAIYALTAASKKGHSNARRKEGNAPKWRSAAFRPEPARPGHPSERVPVLLVPVLLEAWRMLVPALLAARPAGTLRTARVQMVDYTGRTESEWREALTPQEFEVLREAGTEPPWSSPLNELKEPGVLVCTACETPLFRTSEKFESGSGWPSA